MPEASSEHWKEFLKPHPQIHFLQTSEWGDLKARHGWSVVRLIVGHSGAQVLFRQLPLGAQMAYIPKVSPKQIDADDSAELRHEIDGLCAARGAIACKLEPDEWEGDAADRVLEGFTLSGQNIQPRRTIVVNLQGNENSILARMKQKCRYNVRLAQKKGVSVRAWDDISGFHEMLRATAQRDGFALHSLAYYADAYRVFHAAGVCELLLAEADGVALAALMVFARGSRAWYVYGGSTDLQREKMPSYLLQWEAMRWAKERGCSEYDLWGVPDQDEAALESGFSQRSDGLWGVYRFKRGFGGEVRRAAAAQDRIYKPIPYRLYLLAAKARRTAA